MLSKYPLLYLLVILCAMSCSKDVDFDKVKELPVSSIEYTEYYDGVPLTRNYSEADGFIFRDERQYQQDSCSLFISRTIMEDKINNITLAIGFFSQITADQIEDNEVFFKNESDFDNHMSQEIIHFDSGDLCDIPSGQTGFLGVSTQIPLSTLIATVVSEDFELIKFEHENIRYEGLGYLVVDMEFSYTAIQFDFLTGTNVFEVPVTAKFNHAIRFPELDK